jgi:hypothetical protein
MLTIHINSFSKAQVYAQAKQSDDTFCVTRSSFSMVMRVDSLLDTFQSKKTE